MPNNRSERRGDSGSQCGRIAIATRGPRRRRRRCEVGVSLDCHTSRKSAASAIRGLSKPLHSTIRQPGAMPSHPARQFARMLRELPRPAAGRQRDLFHGRHRAGGVLGVLHAKPVLPGPPAPLAGGPRTLERRKPVAGLNSHPVRQPHPHHAGPGRAEPRCIRSMPRCWTQLEHSGGLDNHRRLGDLRA